MKLAAALLLLCVWAGPAEAAVQRFGLVIGANAGHPGEVALRYAHADAQKVHDLLLDLGGFAPEETVLLLAPDVASVRRALLALNERVRAAKAEPDGQALLFVYYSGHADAHGLHLGGDSLPLDELKRMVRGSAADFRLLVLDACRSGAATRRKGGTQGPAFALGVERELAGEGAVILTASAENEDAQESDLLRGSFFTHYLVSALSGAGDDDGDGQVTLEEAYRYAYDATLRESSRSALGLQHPSFQYEVRGQGQIVLTRLSDRHARGALRLPPGRTYLVLAGGAEGAVAAELGREDKARVLSLRPGRYFVRGRGAGDLREGLVTVPPGAERAVREDELQRVAYAQLVRKGGSDMRWVHGPRAALMMRGPLVDGESWCLGGLAGWGLDLPGVTLGARLTACQSRFTNDLVGARTSELGLAIRASRAWDLAPVTLDVGVLAGVAYLDQRFDSTAPAPDRATFAPHVGASFSAAVDLGGGYALALELWAATTFVRRQSFAGGEASEPTRAVFTPGVALGVDMRF
jgi:hypothetical protein